MLMVVNISCQWHNLYEKQGAIGKTVKAKVIKVNKAQNSIIVSRKKIN